MTLVEVWFTTSEQRADILDIDMPDGFITERDVRQALIATYPNLLRDVSFKVDDFAPTQLEARDAGADRFEHTEDVP